MPKPLDPTESYTAVYDAWNRLVELAEADESSSGEGAVVAEYEWDGMGRRIVATSYDDGLLDETRHFYYSQAHQILEERVDGTADSDMDLQYVWGAQYVDELICRDRPGDASSSSSSADAERIYVTYDPSYRITALVDGDKNVLERYRYSPYGQRTVLNADWTVHTDPEEGSYNFRIGHQGLRHDETGLVYNRARMLHVGLGRFTQRDLLDQDQSGGGYHDGMSLYGAHHLIASQKLDPSGLDVAGDTNSGGSKCRCGQEAGPQLGRLEVKMKQAFDKLGGYARWRLCTVLFNPIFALQASVAWEITQMWDQESDGEGGTVKSEPFKNSAGDCATSKTCRHTVQVLGTCHHNWDVNYVLYGWAGRWCNRSLSQIETNIRAYRLLRGDASPTQRLEWARAGYRGTIRVDTPDDLETCKDCPVVYSGSLTGYLRVWNLSDDIEDPESFEIMESV
ncbi:MAG: hypothetical protein WD294_02410 [Phycisphaeraceae bacterium]